MPDKTSTRRRAADSAVARQGEVDKVIVLSGVSLYLEGSAVIIILFIAGLIQWADFAIALWKKARWMMPGTFAGGLIHILCAFAVLMK